jgi:hypothetical protein
MRREHSQLKRQPFKAMEIVVPPAFLLGEATFEPIPDGGLDLRTCHPSTSTAVFVASHFALTKCCCT